MKKNKIISLLSILLSIIFSFNIFAMPKKQYSDTKAYANPYTDSDYQYGYRWIWLNDELCVQFQAVSSETAMYQKDLFQKKYDMGLLTHWYEGDGLKKRESYTGKWLQDESGIWSFIFDDHTIPVGPTKIDGVIYAFNGYGQLIEGYNYWEDLKTGADGLVTSDNPEFLEWLKTQYVPDCTTTKTE